MQCFLYTTTINLLQFIAATAILIKVGDTNNIFNWITFAICFIFFVTAIIRFHLNPHPYGYFFFSFKHNSRNFNHYSFYLAMIVLTGCLLPVSTINEIPSYVPIPLLVLLLYTIYLIFYRPYLHCYENILAFVNLAVLCAFMAFRLYIEILHYKNVKFEMELILLLLMIILILLFGLAILGIIGTFYGFCIEKKAD